MGKALLSLFIISFAFTGPFCYAQTAVQVSDPRLELGENTLHIYYDILNSDPEDKFIIDIEIRDEDGQLINAETLDGDIGDEVYGGSNKHVTWDLEADNVFLDARIFITILAEAILPPVPVIVVQKEEELTQEAPPEEEEISDEYEPETKKEEISEEPVQSKEMSGDFSRTGIILQSLAFPGLGLSRMTGDPHWLRGIAGYGCIAGSIALNRMAVSTYEDYRTTIPGVEKEDFYNKSVNQDNTSEVLAYAAIAIWITDFVWTLVGTSDLKKGGYYSHSSGISMGASYDYKSQTPLLGLQYRF